MGKYQAKSQQNNVYSIVNGSYIIFEPSGQIPVQSQPFGRCSNVILLTLNRHLSTGQGDEIEHGLMINI